MYSRHEDESSISFDDTNFIVGGGRSFKGNDNVGERAA